MMRWREYVKQLKRETHALLLAYRHPETPRIAKLWTLIVVAYALSPIDLIPDFIPVLGYLDDVILLPLGIVLAIKLIPSDIMDECRAQATQSELDKQAGRYAGIVIIAIWVISGILIIGAILNRFI